MKVEITKEDADSIGAVLKALTYARIYNEKNEAITGGELLNLYHHINRVFAFRKKIMKLKEEVPKLKRKCSNESEKEKLKEMPKEEGNDY